MSEESELVRIAIYEDQQIEITDIVFNRERTFNHQSFPLGYATVRIRDELKSYFVIKVKKELLNKLDDSIFYAIMGDSPFILSFEDDSLIYLRTKLEVNDLKPNENENTLSKLLG